VARRPTEWTPETIRSALRKLRRRLTEVQSFEPENVKSRRDPTITVLETAIRETLADVYGPNSRSFRNYHLAAQLDIARDINGVSLPEVVEALVQGKERSILLMSGAIRLLEEKMEDDFPGEPTDKVAFEGRSIAASTGGGGIQVRRIGLVDEGEAAFEVKRRTTGGPLYGGLQGVGTGIAGDISASVQNDAPPNEAASSPENRYAELQARVALLESSVDQLRRELASPREIGIGHNQGPAFAPVPVEELGEIDNLIALLKDRGPVPPSDPTSLIEQNTKVAAIGEKILAGLTVLGTEMAKGGARALAHLCLDAARCVGLAMPVQDGFGHLGRSSRVRMSLIHTRG
jgi:hypothetical protein